MTTIWPILRRLITIIFAYLLASISSGFVVAVLMSIFPANPRPGSPNSEFLFTLGLAVIFITLLAAPPAIITIMIGEWWQIRRKRYYAIAGMLIGLALSLLFFYMNWFPYIGFGYGAVAGLIYWRVAGGRAGALESKPGKSAVQITLAILLVATTFGANELFPIFRF